MLIIKIHLYIFFRSQPSPSPPPPPPPFAFSSVLRRDPPPVRRRSPSSDHNC
ncbi:hypothetical protein HanRHA438_Chr09g0382821 [Helianthus annuus]|nr:hypothetical protein HanRHA438_Chr09g0382821 [Helianthus annuus]